MCERGEERERVCLSDSVIDINIVQHFFHSSGLSLAASSAIVCISKFLYTFVYREGNLPPKSTVTVLFLQVYMKL